jgi:hypothetical protein
MTEVVRQARCTHSVHSGRVYWLFAVTRLKIFRVFGGSMNFVNTFRRILFALACPAFLLGSQPYAHAVEMDPATRAAAVKNLTPVLTAHLTTIDQVMILGALGNASVDSLKIVRTNLLKNYPNGKLPQTSVVKDQFFFDGKATGVHISSSAPLQLNFKGHIWKYDANVAYDKNVQALQTLFDAAQVN